LDLEKNFLLNKYKEIEALGNDTEKLTKYNLTEVAKAVAVGIAKLQKLLMSDNPLPLLGEIQKAAATLEKLQTATIKHETKGVVEHKHTGAILKIDMDHVMELILKAKEKNIQLSPEEAMKIVEAEYKKVES